MSPTIRPEATSSRIAIHMLVMMLAIWPAYVIASTRDNASAGLYDARAYGAIGDGETLDTDSIQKAIDTAADDGGGTVVLCGGTFLSGTLVLKSHVSLRVEAGAVLRASRDIADYPDHTPEIAYLYRPRFTKSLIFAEGAENIALTGRGLIDGQGEHFPAKLGDDKGRPYIVRFSQCRNVHVRDLRFRNSARWLSHYLACENVVIDGITIRSRIRENRDGIDIDSCSDVRVSNCHIFSGDDAIVLKATANRPCRRVTITNCIVSSLASALKLGTESNGGFEDVTISNCVVYDTGYSGIGIMSVDGATLNRVSVSNITMKNVKVPIFIRLGNRARPMPGEEPPGMGALRNVTIRNVQASGVGNFGCSITGIPDFPIDGVTLENIRIRYEGGGTIEDAVRTIPEKVDSYPSGKMFGPLPAYGFFCRHVRNLRLRNLDVAYDETDLRPALVCEDVHDLDVFGLRSLASSDSDAVLRFRDVQGAMVHGCRPHEPTKNYLRVEGVKSRAIAVVDNDLRKAQRSIVRADDVPQDAVQCDTE